VEGQRQRTVATVTSTGKHTTPHSFPIHIPTPWGEVGQPLSRGRLGVHRVVHRLCANPKGILHLQALAGRLHLPLSLAGKGLGPVRSTPDGGSERKLGGERRSNQRAQALGDPGESLRLRQARPIACLVHLAVAQRGAVREAGPRSGMTRSARNGETRGSAEPRADRSRSSSASPTGTLSRQPVARGRKTEGAIPWLRVTVPATARQRRLWRAVVFPSPGMRVSPRANSPARDRPTRARGHRHRTRAGRRSRHRARRPTAPAGGRHLTVTGR
jgi:hypothetical protein